MSGSPLAYPLTRGIDGDCGGAADLQTDIMRFMAILGLCLVAIFALVQSLPIEAQTPAEKPPVVENVPSPPAEKLPPIEPSTPVEVSVQHEPEPAVVQAPAPVAQAAAEKTVALTRPKRVSTFQPIERSNAVASVQPEAAAAPAAPAPPVEDGFTLRFESDTALTRLVASGQVGFYAINSGGAQRMTISDSRISFWDASTPNTFHEMEATTVPRAVIDAHQRSGANAEQLSWGVTLPGKLRAQLNSLMQEHRGGTLVIHADGNLILEAS
jgi:hypothetical protein